MSETYVARMTWNYPPFAGHKGGSRVIAITLPRLKFQDGLLDPVYMIEDIADDRPKRAKRPRADRAEGGVASVDRKAARILPKASVAAS